jgi:hypothetical protein
MRPFRLLSLLAVILLTACRTIAVQSEPRPTFAIDVHNETAEAMIVSYNDGRGDALLGTVPASRTERFVIASPMNTTVTVRATNEARSRSLGPYQVTLAAGSPQPVRLR